MLRIENVHASIGDKEILRGLSLTVKPGEVHAIMGPNGSGKSTLSKVLAGHPDYRVTQGQILFDVNLRPKDLTAMPPEERSRAGIFMAYQYPVEVPGVPNATFLRAAFNAHCRASGSQEMDPLEFDEHLRQKVKLLDMDERFIDRELNVGFSGGEKKRNEILQMAVLAPRLAILDETDSGLDVDSLRYVAEGVNKLRTKANALVVITHYQRILNYLVPDFVYILASGRIAASGDKSLALRVEAEGYDWIRS